MKKVRNRNAFRFGRLRFNGEIEIGCLGNSFTVNISFSLSDRWPNREGPERTNQRNQENLDGIGTKRKWN